MNDWATVQCRLLADQVPGSVERLRRLFARGVDVTTHYSGSGAAETAMSAIADCVDRAVRASMPGGAMPPGYGGAAVHAACDINPWCQDILMNHPQDSRAMHCFGDICALVPLSVMSRCPPSTDGTSNGTALLPGSAAQQGMMGRGAFAPIRAHAL